MVSTALPLQMGIPGLPELIIVFLIFVIGLAITLGAAYWVYTDAKSRGSGSAGLWAAVTAIGFFVGLIPGIVVIVVYLITRD